jgi:hypothetical protein
LPRRRYRFSAFRFSAQKFLTSQSQISRFKRPRALATSRRRDVRIELTEPAESASGV